MNPPNRFEKMTKFERALLQLQVFPWDAIYLALVGFGILSAMALLRVETRSVWTLLSCFFGTLVMVRVIPAIIRKLVPFSPAVQSVWFDRRQIAKRFDSYQWQKLFWIGVGLALHVSVTRRFWMPAIVLALLCLLFGAVGVVRWRTVSSRTAVLKGLATQAGTPA
jgi:hypothetical protein